MTRTEMKQIERLTANMLYLSRVRKNGALEVAAPLLPGWIVVHNGVQASSRLGVRGFRAWLARGPEKTHVRCRCGWAPGLPKHYRAQLAR